MAERGWDRRRHAVAVFADSLMVGESTLDEFPMWMMRSEGSVEGSDWRNLYRILSKAHGGSGHLKKDVLGFLWGPDGTLVVHGGERALAEHLLRGGEAVAITPTETPAAAALWPFGKIAVLREPTDIPLPQAFLRGIEDRYWYGYGLLGNLGGVGWTITRFAMGQPGEFFEVGAPETDVMLVEEAENITTAQVEQDFQQLRGAELEITRVLEEGRSPVDLDRADIVRVVGLVADSLEIWEDGVIRPVWHVRPLDYMPDPDDPEWTGYYIHGLTRSMTGEVGNPDMWEVVHIPERSLSNPTRECLCPIVDMMYGGMPSVGGYSSSTMVEVGAQQIAEAAHCILGSLGKLHRPYREDWDWRWGIRYEKDHLGEEIDIIRRWVFECDQYGWHKGDVEKLHHPERYGYEEYVRHGIESVRENSPKLLELAVEMRRLTEENCRGIPTPVKSAALFAYDVIIALAGAMQRAFAFAPGSFYNPFVDRDLKLATNLLWLEIESLIKMEKRP